MSQREITMSSVVVVIGAGQIGQAIARRVGVGKHVVLADMRLISSSITAEPKMADNKGSRPYRAIHLLLLAVIGFANPLHGQPITPQSASVATPKTAAGEALRAWLDAFNSADSARISDYARRFQPDISLGDELGFRDQTGGLQRKMINHDIT
jgi:NAD(P)-dependent dehydrogenase (short-subunit alcohol dehydrogenase family)